MRQMAPKQIKVNIGCGLSGIDGWVNLDNSPTILLSRIPLLRRVLNLPAWPKDVRRCDVRKGLPFASGSAECIYSSHTFEHFTYDESLKIAKECSRVLRPGGVLRIVVPDLELIAREYLNDTDPMAAQTFIGRLALKQSVHDWIHPGSHHSQMLDGRCLVRMLQDAGFAQPQIRAFGESAIPEISRLDLEVRRSESVYVEAIR